jgi:hypothetical protein
MGVWWRTIDRGEELAALRALIPVGGCLVLRGDDKAGRSEAVRLLLGELEEFGYDCFGISRALEHATVKTLLTYALREITGAPTNVVHAPGAQSLQQVVSDLASAAQGRDPTPALVFEDPDRRGPLPSDHVTAFGDLAEQGGIPVLVSSRRESRTRWPTEGSLQIRELGNFTRDDVLTTLMNSRELKGSSLNELIEIADFITGGTKSVRPLVAYSRLHAFATL